jgi:hypothetical protein
MSATATLKILVVVDPQPKLFGKNNRLYDVLEMKSTFGKQNDLSSNTKEGT